LLDFRRAADKGSREALPPADIIRAIASMNVAKRSVAIRNAEAMIKNGEISKPPSSLIPTFMAAGRELPGVEDSYMKEDHPSQELFAYNRLGKRSWLNRRFGEHCLTAIGFAHPSGIVEPAIAPTRVKAHRPEIISVGGSVNGISDEWIVISSKNPVAQIYENERQAALISRVTGAVNVNKSTHLEKKTLDAIVHLSRPESVFEHDESTILGQKALILAALEQFDGADDSPFYPVIQTMYLTQIQ
jgi:hypothetical protein